MYVYMNLFTYLLRERETKNKERERESGTGKGMEHSYVLSTPVGSGERKINREHRNTHSP